MVLSTCYSGKLGKLMFEAGIPVVVSINTSCYVLEKAAYAFNRTFLSSLLNEKTIEYSFKQGKNNVESSNYNNTICCC